MFSVPSVSLWCNPTPLPFGNAPGGTRTPSLRIRNPLLCPVELRARTANQRISILNHDLARVRFATVRG